MFPRARRCRGRTDQCHEVVLFLLTAARMRVGCRADDAHSGVKLHDADGYAGVCRNRTLDWQVGGCACVVSRLEIVNKVESAGQHRMDSAPPLGVTNFNICAGGVSGANILAMREPDESCPKRADRRSCHGSTLFPAGDGESCALRVTMMDEKGRE